MEIDNNININKMVKKTKENFVKFNNFIYEIENTNCAKNLCLFYSFINLLINNDDLAIKDDENNSFFVYKNKSEEIDREKSAANLKKILLNFMLTDNYKYKTSTGTIEEYVENHSKNNDMISHEAIKAFSRITNRDIFLLEIYQDINTPKFQQIYLFKPDNGEESQTIDYTNLNIAEEDSLVLFFEDNHYSSLNNIFVSDSYEENEENIWKDYYDTIDLYDFNGGYKYINVIFNFNEFKNKNFNFEKLNREYIPNLKYLQTYNKKEYDEIIENFNKQKQIESKKNNKKFGSLNIDDISLTASSNSTKKSKKSIPLITSIFKTPIKQIIEKVEPPILTTTSEDLPLKETNLKNEPEQDANILKEPIPIEEKKILEETPNLDETSKKSIIPIKLDTITKPIPKIIFKTIPKLKELPKNISFEEINEKNFSENLIKNKQPTDFKALKNKTTPIETPIIKPKQKLIKEEIKEKEKEEEIESTKTIDYNDYFINDPSPKLKLENDPHSYIKYSSNTQKLNSFINDKFIIFKQMYYNNKSDDELKKYINNNDNINFFKYMLEDLKSIKKVNDFSSIIDKNQDLKKASKQFLKCCTLKVYNGFILSELNYKLTLLEKIRDLIKYKKYKK